MMLKNFDKETLKNYVKLPRNISEVLSKAAHHALDTEGSFCRANLAQGVGASTGLGPSRSEAIGASVELFHLASLILDDLPCMDNANSRRSRDCTHSLFGESTAMLTALGFINQAYLILWNIFSKVDETRQKEASDLVNSCLGFDGILDGQSRDINFQRKFSSKEAITHIAVQKTGSLLRLCIMLPAILGSATRYEKMHLAKLARYWGMAYQIADDLKDIYLGESASGKTSQRDEILGRPNMVLAIGEQASAEMLESVLLQASTSLERLSDQGETVYVGLYTFQSQLTKVARPLIAAHFAA